MKNDSQNTETTQPEITYDVGGWTKVSGATKVSVILDAEDAEAPRVYTFNAIGSGTPMHVWHRRHRVIATVDVQTVPDALEEALREREDTVRAIAARYLGKEWDGSNHVGRWSDDGSGSCDDDLDLGSLPTFWAADEWFAGDPRAVIACALDAGSIEAATKAEVENARTEGAWLDADDAEKALRSLLETERERLDVDEEDERAERLRIATLLGERDEEAEAGAREAIVEVDLDSVVVFPPELDEGEERDGAEALSHYIGVDVTVDGESVRVGCVVGAPESQHGTVRASGAGVRPFCEAWWADASDYQELSTQAVRDAVLDALVAQSWQLFQRACDEA